MPMASKAYIRRYIREHVSAHFYDDSFGERFGRAIYSLSDPRDIRAVRYVGQTLQPRRRFLQHLNTARLWLPEERPFWVVSAKLRPLYDWIRELHRCDERLPTMVVHEWAPSSPEARLRERALIHACLAQHMSLLNVEAEVMGRQLALL